MKVLFALDDTDNLESIGTGHLLESIAGHIETEDWGTRSFITRHQLLVHPDIPYTSHNSAMCCTAELAPERLEEFVAYAKAFVDRARAAGSDPGLCVAVAEDIREAGDLVAFGQRAKTTILSKDEAFATARVTGLRLSEHGGTGQGVIGAFAAVGLRLGGNDGRIRGHVMIQGSGGIASVGQIRAHPQVGSVRSVGGEVLGDDELVVLQERQKMVLRDGLPILLVVPSGSDSAPAPWRSCSRELLEHY